MGTHPIFESDFDCLTEMSDGRKVDLGFIYKMLDTRDPSKRRVKPADPDFLPVDAFAPDEPTQSDDEYQPQDDEEEEEAAVVETSEEQHVKRKRKTTTQTTSPNKIARKEKIPTERAATTSKTRRKSKK